jgi:hypothetical protein
VSKANHAAGKRPVELAFEVAHEIDCLLHPLGEDVREVCDLPVVNDLVFSAPGKLISLPERNQAKYGRHLLGASLRVPADHKRVGSGALDADVRDHRSVRMEIPRDEHCLLNAGLSQGFQAVLPVYEPPVVVKSYCIRASHPLVAGAHELRVPVDPVRTYISVLFVALKPLFCFLWADSHVLSVQRFLPRVCRRSKKIVVGRVLVFLCLCRNHKSELLCSCVRNKRRHAFPDLTQDRKSSITIFCSALW